MNAGKAMSDEFDLLLRERVARVGRWYRRWAVTHDPHGEMLARAKAWLDE